MKRDKQSQLVLILFDLTLISEEMDIAWCGHLRYQKSLCYKHLKNKRYVPNNLPHLFTVLLFLNISGRISSDAISLKKLYYTQSLQKSEELVNVSVVMESVFVMIRPNFLSAANRLELELCLRRHLEEYGIARRANAILL